MINAILFPVFEFFAKNKWARWALVFALAVLTLGIYIHGREKKAAERTAQKYEREALKEQTRVDTTRREISQENQDASQRADEAVRDLPAYRHTDELREQDPGLAALVLGTGAGRGGGSENR